MDDAAPPPAERDPLDRPFTFEAEPTTSEKPPTPAPAPPRPNRFGPFLIYAATWAMVAALLLPWSYRTDRIFTTSENALASTEGRVESGLVLVTLLLSMATVHAGEPRVRRRRAAALLVAAGLACLVADVFLIGVSGGIYRTEGGTLVVERSVGVGPLAMTVFGIVLAFGASMVFRAAKTAPSRRPKNLDDPGGAN